LLCLCWRERSLVAGGRRGVGGAHWREAGSRRAGQGGGPMIRSVPLGILLGVVSGVGGGDLVIEYSRGRGGRGVRGVGGLFGLGWVEVRYAGLVCWPVCRLRLAVARV